MENGIVTQFILPLLGAVGGGLSAYVAIRTDLATIKAQIAIMQKSVERAHERIDVIFSQGK